LALYEKKTTLLEAEHLIDRGNKRFRFRMTIGLSKRSVAQDWEYANALSPRDFDAQISSTVNRFHSFLHNEKLRLMFGQSGASLDIGTALVPVVYLSCWVNAPIKYSSAARIRVF
jgi:hypothetical protein